MLFLRSTRQTADSADLETAAPALVHDLQALSRATAVNRPFLDQLGQRLQGRAALAAEPIVSQPGRLIERLARPALAAGLALALTLSVGGLGPTVLAAGPDGLGAKVQQLVQALAAKLGVPEDQIEVQSLADGRAVIHLPAGGKEALLQVNEAKQVVVPSGALAEGKIALDVARVAATALGVSPEQLKQELPGRSLAELAQAHGVAPEVLADALRAAVQRQAGELPPAKLDAVIDKLMTQAVAETPR